MTCTECNEPIPFEDDIKVMVIFQDGRIEEHCKHNPFDESDSSIIATLSSRDCYRKYRTRLALLSDVVDVKTIIDTALARNLAELSGYLLPDDRIERIVADVAKIQDEQPQMPASWVFVTALFMELDTYGTPGAAEPKGFHTA